MDIATQGIQSLWPGAKPLIGMVHLRPLPGSPRWGGSMEDVVTQALADADALAEGGVDGILVENFLDAPFFAGAAPPSTIAAMTRVVSRVVAGASVPVGVNVLRNDAQGALAVAVAAGAGFIRVNVHTGIMWTDQGTVEGDAAATLRTRQGLGAPVAILADVLVKHATPPPGLTVSSAASDTWRRGLADALIVSGTGTGKATDLGRVAEARDGAPDAAVLVGSGVTPETVARVLEVADGAIVGSCLAHGGLAGAGIAPDRVRKLVGAARG